MNCDWCSHEYVEFNAETERQHLAECSVFQALPVAESRNGKTFVKLPGYDDILVERVRLN